MTGEALLGKQRANLALEKLHFLLGRLGGLGGWWDR
jgi:hypothetical protein